MMSIYRIAGYLLEAPCDASPSGPGSLDVIPGFPSFRLEKAETHEKPLLRFDTNIPLRNWTVEPQYRFMVEKSVCDFSGTEDVYLFRMALPENHRPCLVEIHPEGDTFRAFSNWDRLTPEYVLRFALWIAFGVAALHRQTVAIHASSIVYEGKSVLFLGESGTGKSTHTQLWLRHIPDTELLNDDSPFLNAGDDMRVYGSPWSGKTPCYNPLHVPLAALVRLRQAPFNRIRRLNSLEAIAAVLPSFPPEFAYDKTLSGYIHAILSKVLQHTPAYVLDCRPDAAAAKMVWDTLQKNLHLKSRT